MWETDQFTFLFFMPSAEESQHPAATINSTFPSMELERSLKVSGRLGLSKLAQVLGAGGIHKVAYCLRTTCAFPISGSNCVP